MLYLIHLNRPFHHARHYLGYVRSKANLAPRLESHRKGTGAKLLRAVNLAGIEWEVSRTWPDGTRAKERALKNGANVPHYCPICRASRKRWRKRNG